MDRLNYFNPFKTKENSHEDQLTRAYMVLLRLSGHAMFSFLDYCRSNRPNDIHGPTLSYLDYLDQDHSFQTQRSNPAIDTDYLLSVLITDSNLAAGQIQPSERNARYDGLITFGSKLTIVIENKPNSYHVWFGQLNPSRQNLADETEVCKTPIVLEWKEIISHLNQLLSVPTLTGTEKMLIEDFLSYIDSKWGVLNPFDSFDKCKSNKELLERRIGNLLQGIVKDPEVIKYHRSWGHYIHTPYEEIQEIGLILDHSENGWHLELSLFFGDSQRQASAFYRTQAKLERITEKQGWYHYPNFHVSFMTSNLVWFKSPDSHRYLEFWANNTSKIYQHKREDIPNFLDDLVSNGVIELTHKSEEELERRFYNTSMTTLNICPGYGLVFEISSQDAEELDRNGQLEPLIAAKIKEGLAVINRNGSDLLR